MADLAQPLAAARPAPAAPIFTATKTLLVLLLERLGWARHLAFFRARRGYLYDGARWDAEYRSGQWRFLHGLDQAAHSQLIELYRRRLKPLGAVLDIGCGEAILYDIARGMAGCDYLGIDISETAIASAKTRVASNARFAIASAESFRSAERFDTVIFNESLYYYRDPRATMLKYLAMLRPGGIVIVSMAICGIRDGLLKLKIWHDLESVTETVAETSLVAPSAGWIVKVLRPKPG